MSWLPPSLEKHLHHLFDDLGFALQLRREELTIDPDVSPDEAIDFYFASFGPMVKARELLEPQGRWESFREDVAPRIRRFLTQPASYLLATGHRDA